MTEHLPQYTTPSHATLNTDAPHVPARWGVWMTLVWLSIWFFATQVLGALLLIAAYIGWNELGFSLATMMHLGQRMDVMMWVTLWSNLLCAPLLVVMVKSKRGSVLTDYLALHKVSVGKVVLWVFLCFASVIAVGVLHEAMGWPRTDFMSSLKQTQSTTVLFVSVVLIAPVFEEWVMRGFAYAGFERALGTLPAIALTTVIFTFLHVQYNLYELLQVGVLGLVLALARWHTRSLWTPIIMHGLNNLWATLVVIFFTP